MNANDLERDGFRKDADVGLYYRADDTGGVTSFGKRTVHEGGEEGHELVINRTTNRAMSWNWAHRYHPHPDADPDFSFEDLIESEKSAMLQSGFKPACAFCGKSDTEVARLIAGPQSMICNECVMLCHEILTG